MQLSASEALDLVRRDARETTLSMYGVGEPETDSFGRRCLLARRLVERGVRFVQIFLEEQPWDSHVGPGAEPPRAPASRTDKPVAGLLRGLETKRPARFNAGHLGRGVRTDADIAAIGRYATRDATTTCKRFHVVDGRRRSQRWHDLRSD